MKEQLISFETAKLAKEKGFDWNTGKSYTSNGILFEHEIVHHDGEHFPFAPTQSLLQKWLRELHNIILIVAPIHETEEIKSLIKYWYYILDIEDVSDDEVFYGTWEEALEFGLQEALKLIKTKQ